MSVTETRAGFGVEPPHDSSAQDWEKWWWGGCLHTFGEEAKQLSYAHRMGLANLTVDGKWPVYDLEGKSVLDVGGGPVSMLLKTVNGGRLTVVDPCPYPKWVRKRYEAAGIVLVQEAAETHESLDGYDEAWLYNCLQHTESPRKIIRMIRAHADRLRIFEWIETETNVGHPHSLHADELNDWIGGEGAVEQINENGAAGLCYYGTFPL